MSSRVLAVDDDRSMCELIEDTLATEAIDVVSCTSPTGAFDMFCEGGWDAVVTDLRMPGLNGLELCARMVANRPDVPVIVMTGFGSLDTAIQAIRAGAYDFVTKPVSLEVLRHTVRRALATRSLREKVASLEDAIASGSALPDDMIGNSTAMRRLSQTLRRVAPTDATVLVTGESGTGKELVARALHRWSRRAARPFVAINCAAIPENLLESELFGHAAGAFTGAQRAHEGLFRRAHGGTIFLDEIGELPKALQPKLLRALEEGHVHPVGEDRDVAFDARVLTATNRDLEAEVEAGRFREDLFYRVNVIRLDLPPLRARGTDTLLLAQHFVEVFAKKSQRRVVGLTEGAAKRLLAYQWPGNIRELRNAIERAVALTQLERLTVEDLPPKIRRYRATELVLGGEDPTELATLEEVERRYILHVLRVSGESKTVAAQILGVDRKTLYRKLKRYEAESLA